MAAMVLIETEGATRASRGKDTALRDWLRALESTAPIAANPHRLLPGIIEQLAQTCGEAPALLAAGESLTYRALAAHANVFSRWALDQGLAKGETVCLMMPNRPEYLAIWLGLTARRRRRCARSTPICAVPHSPIASTSWRRSTS